MRHVLVYGDSLSWGIHPGTRERHPFGVRWPTVLERGLAAHTANIRVLEDCLNGRRTVFDDPFLPGRNGLHELGQTIEKHSPLALVIVMLGTNDFQSMHPHNAWHASRGMARLVKAIREAPIEPGMPVPQVLIVCPPAITRPAGTIAPKFAGGELKCVGLAAAYSALAAELDCPFFDAGTVVTASTVDGVHLDAAAHVALGAKMAAVVTPLLR
ncbi:MAG: SGNH/GDSL hydrolase family protein [Betaproteobacteria bacterium]|nr:SGNH/GDSL hydrolase family protein [Betaproteobacteria bacterium]